MKRLGIIGGMGPAATVRLFERITQLTDAAHDQDHLDVRIVSNPAVPDRTAYLLGAAGSQDFVPLLQQEAAELESMGCEVLAMPCNTAHARLADIASVLHEARFVDMIGETAKAAKEAGASRTAILATGGTVKCGLFQSALEQHGIAWRIPDRSTQELVNALIFDYVKAGRMPEDDLLAACVSQMAEQGCDVAVLGCTELSVLHTPVNVSGCTTIDALDVLARRCIVECGAAVRAEGGRDD